MTKNFVKSTEKLLLHPFCCTQEIHLFFEDDIYKCITLDR